jgi:hypothetical protein
MTAYDWPITLLKSCEPVSRKRPCSKPALAGAISLSNWARTLTPPKFLGAARSTLVASSSLAVGPANVSPPNVV